MVYPFSKAPMVLRALVAPSYPPIYGAIDSFRRLIITPILVLSAIPGLDRAIMG